MTWRPSFAALVTTLFAVWLVTAGLIPAAAPLVKAQVPPISFECGSVPGPCSVPQGGTITVHGRDLDTCEAPVRIELINPAGAAPFPLDPPTITFCFDFDRTFTVPATTPIGDYHVRATGLSGNVLATSAQLLTVGTGGGPGLTSISGVAACFVDGDFLQPLPGALVELFSGDAKIAETIAAPVTARYDFFRVADLATYQVRYTSRDPVVTCGSGVSTDGETQVPPTRFCPDQAWDIAQKLNSGQQISESICKANHSIWRRISVAPGQQISILIGNANAKTRVALFNDLRQDFNGLLTRPGPVDVRVLDATLSGPTSAPWDASPWDASPWDASPWDASPWDASPWDASPWDASPWDASPWDASKLCTDAHVDPAQISDDACAGAYVSVQMRNLLAFSNTGEITRNTWDNTGEYYIRVFNVDDSFDTTQQLTILATTVGTCGVPPFATQGPTLLKTRSSFLLPSGLGTTLPGGKSTLVFTHTGRVTGPNGLPLSDITNAAQRTTFLNTMNAFATHPTVNGVVVDFAADAGMLANYAQWDTPPFPSCPAAANIVSGAMHDLINGYRVQSAASFQYVTILGGHTAVPYRITPDHAEIEQEKRYNPGLTDLSKSATTLASSYVMTDNYFISFTPISRLESEISLPDANLAVGRLVEFSDDISNALQTYLDNNGVMKPSAALTTGYSFMTDFATAEANVFAQSGVADNEKLISETWTAPDLKARLFDPDRDGVTQPNFDILALNWHARSNEAAAADYSTPHPSIVKSSDIAGFTDDTRFRNVLVISLGCHLAHPLINGDVIKNPSTPPEFVTDARAFTETFLNKGAMVLGNTGYGYGDTDFVAYGERLIVGVTQEFRYFDQGTTPGPVPVGKALTRAKRVYVQGMSSLTGVDKKTVEQLTFYGPPMWSIDMPTRVVRPATPSITPGLASTGITGLLSGIVSPAYTLNRQSLGDSTYFEADTGGIQQLPFRSVMPYKSFELKAGAGQNARGVALISADYTDSTTQAVVSLPATEVPGQRPPWVTRGFWPAQTSGLNHLTGNSLSVTPVQWQSDNGFTGISRQYPTSGAQQLRLFYSTLTGGAAFAGPASLRDVSVSSNGTLVHIEVTVNGANISDVFDMLVNFTGVAGAANGKWRTCSLVPGRTDGPTTTKSCLNAASPVTVASGSGWFMRRYSADIETAGQTPNPADLRMAVQAITGTGLVSTRNNAGQYFRVITETATTTNPKGSTSIVIQPLPDPITYNRTSKFTAKLSSNRERCKVSGQELLFTLGSQTRTGVTDSGGTASVDFNVLAIPDDYTLSVLFAETPDCLSSTAQKAAKVIKKNTSLTFGTTPFVVTLKDADNQLMREQYVFFTVKGGGKTVTRSALTDARGVAQLRDLQLPNGTYTVTASFPGTIPTATGTIQLVDERYNPAPPISKTLVADNKAPSCDLTATGVDSKGRAYIKVTVRDTGSGLASVNPTELVNATLALSNPNYVPGTTSAIVVTATKTNQSQAAVVALEVVDVAGNVTHCDPVMVTLGRGDDESPARFTATITSDEVYVTVINGDPGVKNVRLKVNRTTFEVRNLKDGETRTLNIAKAMKRGKNTVTISVQGGGRRDGTAVVIIADVPTNPSP